MLKKLARLILASEENERLKARVAELENEVADLKSQMGSWKLDPNTFRIPFSPYTPPSPYIVGDPPPNSPWVISQPNTLPWGGGSIGATPLCECKEGPKVAEGTMGYVGPVRCERCLKQAYALTVTNAGVFEGSSITYTGQIDLDGVTQQNFTLDPKAQHPFISAFSIVH